MLPDDSFDDSNHQGSDLLLDDNGFPLHLEEEEDEGSFAADFYRCGTDWSCLVRKRDTDDTPAHDRKLKQANLFQMWGGAGGGGAKKPRLQHHQPNHANIPNPQSSSTSIANRPRVCPFYKKIPGTSFTVDAFRYGCVEGCSAYFLTHFHADHYGGLTKGWSHGPIYCTPLTARLLTLCLSVNPSFINPLELDKEHAIQGVKVTLLDANHCPGAALIHFRLPDGKCYLHTGDFRASKLMQAYPLLVNHRVNLLYLDTTYCNPRYKFPSKEDVLSFVVEITNNYLKKQPRTLVVVGAYSIGKECVYLAISKALGVKVFANASRRRILQSFGWPELSSNLCTNGKDTLLHVLPISSLRFETLKDYLKTYREKYAAVLAFRPTGWTYSEKIGNQLDLIRPISRGNVTIYGVPYSEHSSFTELQEFVQFLKPGKIIPTVNVGNATNRDKMQSHFRQWLRG
ncbi:Beta-lactamase-like protein [Corchorus capsularis]|uniref:Beta-lactamase-like protein n=1 Tax=Corchorus capsularis TaxID=210143 RepID=A0A1R3ISN6_COCAP|nr:Beta-lactamase-like protein [Corchorus capsularis]